MHARGRAARAASASPLVLAGLSSSMATRLDLPVLLVVGGSRGWLSRLLGARTM